MIPQHFHTGFMQSNHNIPYTYLIGWSEHNIWYYGVRYAKKCNPSDLWKTYFTSSKYVKEHTELYGDPNIIEIRKTFSYTQQATRWEEKVIRRMNCVRDGNWLNRGNARKQFYNTQPNSSSFQKGGCATKGSFGKGNVPWNANSKGMNLQEFTPERNDKVSRSLCRNYQITYPNGSVEIITGLKQFCKDLGWNYPTVSQISVSGPSPRLYRNHKVVRVDNRPSGHYNKGVV